MSRAPRRRSGVDRDRADTILGIWIYFLHPPRDNFAAAMTDEERAAFTRTASGSGGCWPTGC